MEKIQSLHKIGSRIRYYTKQSSLVHVGFASAFFLTALLLVLLIYFNSLTPTLESKWKFMSIVGGILGIISLILFHIIYHADAKHRDETDIKKNSTITILKKTLREHKTVLIYFWLIMTGLMYQYYASTAVATEFFARNGGPEFISGFIFILVNGSNVHMTTYEINELTYATSMLVVTFLSLIAHSYLGFVASSVRQRKGFHILISKLVNELIKINNRVRNMIIEKFLEQRYGASPEPKQVSEEDVKENIDFALITFLAIIAFIVGILFSILSIALGHNNNGFFNWYYVFNIIIVFITNAGFALTPSLLSSMFPHHLRTTGANLSYVGGLALGFAAPFISMSTLIKTNNPGLLFFTVSIGAVFIIIGGTKLIKRNIPRPDDDLKVDNC